MLTVNIICIGKLKEKYLRDAGDEYAKRLNGFCKLNVIELTPFRLPDNPNPTQIKSALEDEGVRILQKIQQSDMVYALCIEGREISSEKLASEIERCSVSGYSTIDFIIGGSYGLSPEVKSKAAFRLSMSPMTFPHQLARIMLLEQVYRSFMISSGGKYHK